MNEQNIIHLDNLTEEEREQFTKLLGKASEEPSKESRVWKPKKIAGSMFIIQNPAVKATGISSFLTKTHEADDSGHTIFDSKVKEMDVWTHFV